MIEEDSKIEIDHTVGICLVECHTKENHSLDRFSARETLGVEIEESLDITMYFDSSRSRNRNKQVPPISGDQRSNSTSRKHSRSIDQRNNKIF